MRYPFVYIIYGSCFTPLCECCVVIFKPDNFQNFPETDTVQFILTHYEHSTSPRLQSCIELQLISIADYHVTRLYLELYIN